MLKQKKIVIFGDSAFAELAHYYFEKESEYSVVCFAVESEFHIKNELNNLPVITLEELLQEYSPNDIDIFVAITYINLNRTRERIFKQIKSYGYKMASFISPKCNVALNCSIGEHCFIFEGNNIQPYVKIGNNVILWSGNHIGHHSLINDNVFVASHVVLSGYCVVGNNSFLGVNSTISNGVKIGCDNFLEANALVKKSCGERVIHTSTQSKISSVNSHKLFKIKE